MDGITQALFMAAAGGVVGVTAWTLPGSGKAPSSDWGVPGNITANDNTDASASAVTTTGYLIGYNFGFSIPSGAVILGIEARAEAWIIAGSGTLSLLPARATKNASAGTPTVTSAGAGSGSTLTGSRALYTMTSGTTELFGTSWTQAEVIASDFGVCLACSVVSGGPFAVGVDYIEARIHYIVD